MKDNLNKIKELCKNINYTGNTSDEFLYTINCVDYFYFSKNIGAIDIKDGFTDGPNDGGIDFIYADDEKIYFIQGKTQTNLSYNDIRDIFSKIRETYLNLKARNYLSYNDRLKQSFLNIYESFATEPNIEFVLFTNTSISDDMRNKIEILINDSAFIDYTITIYDKLEIESRILSIEQGNTQIPYGELEIDIPKNFLTYNNNASIFSIKANSLKILYDKYSTQGLFGYNLREHIQDKKVDTAIDLTINNNREQFWYLNNGITIGCSDFYIDGNKLKLENFSIINGAQTTYKIGKSSKINKDYDFCLVCKVVKAAASLNDQFIRSISEASNSQKPIKPRDLRSNSIEQQLLQQKARENQYSLAIDIKRGVRPPNYKRVNNTWERITNEYLGQLILAADYQEPGFARSNKADIFSKDAIYNKLYSREQINKYNYNTLYDLVRIANYYDSFKIEFSEELEKEKSLSTDESEKIKLSNTNIMLQNAKFTVLALIMYFYKIHYMKLDYNSDKVFKQNLNSNLSLNYKKDDYLEKLNYLFQFLVEKLSYIYETSRINNNITSQSNFLKLNNTYKNIIIPNFYKMYTDKYDSPKIIDNLKIFEEDS